MDRYAFPNDMNKRQKKVKLFQGFWAYESGRTVANSMRAENSAPQFW